MPGGTLGMREYPASVLPDHLLSACYNEAEDSYILKCGSGTQHLAAEVDLRETRKYRRHAVPQSTKPLT